MGAEIQFACIGVFRTALFFHLFEKCNRIFLFYLRAAFQIFFTLCVLQIISCRATPSIAITEGQEKGIQISLLASVLPDADQLARVCAVGIAGRQEGGDLGAIHALPVEVMVRELFSFIIGPENLLSHQISDTAAF